MKNTMIKTLAIAVGLIATPLATAYAQTGTVKALKITEAMIQECTGIYGSSPVIKTFQTAETSPGRGFYCAFPITVNYFDIKWDNPYPISQSALSNGTLVFTADNDQTFLFDIKTVPADRINARLWAGALIGEKVTGAVLLWAFLPPDTKFTYATLKQLFLGKLNAINEYKVELVLPAPGPTVDPKPECATSGC